MSLEQQQPRAARVKNKTPAAVQITAEQILRESKDRQDGFRKLPTQKIEDEEELSAFRAVKRQLFEDSLRKDRTNMGSWIKYASWEESQYEIERARSIYERAIDSDHRSHAIWLKYSEMEMKLKNINRARNIFNRAVQLLPRVDTFWYKFTYMEELVNNVAGARQIFERWMAWEPTEEAWMAFIKFEQRYQESEKARNVFKRFVETHPESKNWLKWSKFEENNGNIDFAREIYEQCFATIGEEFIDQNFYVSFAKFETRLKEYERARAIYKYALEKLPQGQKNNLHNVYIQFEKQHGGKQGIDDVVLTRRRKQYEEILSKNPADYDTWFDYIRLEEEHHDHEKIRDIYERAISQVPPIKEKRYWSRYIYLWIFYAIWEEVEAADSERAKKVFIQCLSVIPHKSFTFAKVWILYAKCLIRQKDLAAARKTLGSSIGLAAKEKLFKGYIELELQLREFDRARQLYQKYLEWNSSNCSAWNKFAELENTLGDSERARAIYEIAINQPLLDMPEVIWKGFIDFETSEEEWGNARSLYERLLERSDHVKVWMSFAEFEMIALDNGDISERVIKSRKVYEKAYECLKTEGEKEARVILLEAMLEFEKEHGDESRIESVQKLMPKSVKKRRRLMDENGEPTGWEEYYDYIFPDDANVEPNVKLLELAHQWKMKMAEAANKK